MNCISALFMNCLNAIVLNCSTLWKTVFCIVMNCSASSCIVMALSCIVLLNCPALLWIAFILSHLYCILFHCYELFCIVLHCPELLWIVMNCSCNNSQFVLHCSALFSALFCIVLHCILHCFQNELFWIVMNCLLHCFSIKLLDFIVISLLWIVLHCPTLSCIVNSIVLNCPALSCIVLYCLILTNYFYKTQKLLLSIVLHCPALYITLIRVLSSAKHNKSLSI